jgi:hypothetical protein
MRTPDDALQFPLMIASFGEPLLSISFPLWPNAGGVHNLVDGDNGSAICKSSMRLNDFIYDVPIYHYMNTYRAHECRRFFDPFKENVSNAIEQLIRDWSMEEPTADDIRHVQDSLIEYIYTAYSNGVELFISEPITTLPDELEINLWPNPFNTSLRINIDSKYLLSSVSIHDVKGHLVDVIYFNATNDVDSIIDWRPNNLESGVYIITATLLNGQSASVRSIYIK